MRETTTSIAVGSRAIGAQAPCYLIAEVGSNHDGDLGTAKRYVRACAEAGADAVKFQSFRADRLCRSGSAGFETLRSLELPDAWHGELRDEARRAGIDFLSTPFDEERIDLLVELGCPALKIASGDLTHTPLLRRAAASDLPVLLSTGLATLEEVREAVETLRRYGNPPLALLHCVAAYPAPFASLNLRCLSTLAEAFACPVGFSDHSAGDTAAVAAVALGAKLVEKHVTFDPNAPGPDHGFAISMDAFSRWVQAVRNTESALGNGEKRPAPCEADGRIGGRRAVYTAAALRPGEALSTTHLKVVRPAGGLSPAELDAVVGRHATRSIDSDEAISWRDLR